MILYDHVKVIKLLDRHKNPNKLPCIENYEDYLDKEGVVVYITHGYSEDRYIVKFADGKELCFSTGEVAFVPPPVLEFNHIALEDIIEES